MFLVPHIVIALSSIVYSTFLFISPSKTKLHVTYALTGLTILSGTLLVITSSVKMLSVCETGLTYLAIMFIAIFSAQRRLAKENVRIK